MYTAVAMYRDEEESIGYSFRFYTQVMVNYSGIDRSFGGSPLDADQVKLLSVNGIAPTIENIKNGSYPFTQDVFAVTAGMPNPHVYEIIDWLLSPQGQELIEKTGYVGIN
jgi:phosphate transport system substrate-binding protein